MKLSPIGFGWDGSGRTAIPSPHSIPETPPAPAPKRASAQHEITLEDIKKYCEKRGLVILTSEFYNEMKSGWSSAQPEIIQCKDCKHWDGYYCHNKYWGDGNGYYTPPIKAEDGFCDWAERKENE